MNDDRIEEDFDYDPNRLLNTVMQKLHLKNDAALSKTLEVSPATVSKIRHMKLRIGGSLLIRMHEITDYSIKELRGLMGDYRPNYSESRKIAESRS
jgi:plasmid maintenance system antidote protein VapI